MPYRWLTSSTYRSVAAAPAGSGGVTLGSNSPAQPRTGVGTAVAGPARAAGCGRHHAGAGGRARAVVLARVGLSDHRPCAGRMAALLPALHRPAARSAHETDAAVVPCPDTRSVKEVRHMRIRGSVTWRRV